MEAGGSQGFRPETMPSASQSNALDVKPLRCLVPITPPPFMFNPFAGSNPLPFFGFPPFGPFPPGVSPAFPTAFVRPEAQRVPPEQATDAPAKENSEFSGGTHCPVDVPTSPSLSVEETANGGGKASESMKNEGDVDHVDPDSGNVEGNKSKRHISKKQACRMACCSSSKALPKKKKSLHSIGRKLFGESERNSDEKKKKKKHNESNSKKVKKSKIAVSSGVLKKGMFSEDPREMVERILIIYDAVRRRLLQLDDAEKEATGMAGGKRPDLKAGTIMMTDGLRVNMEKRIGTVPGVNVGDLFYFRMELCLVGLHAPIMGGIDYMSVKFDEKDEPLATSIVSSGGYEDDEDDGETLIYSGQGGNDYKHDKKQIDDQKLERGNLALEQSLNRGNEIRVIRGKKDMLSPSGKTYIYDGLYKIHKSWIDKGKSGFSVFKYKLQRIPGQPNLGSALWRSTQQWKENPSSRGSVIIPDISSGIENLPVCLVNDVDSEKGPAHFVYVTRVRYLKSISMMEPYPGCNCQKHCAPGDANCNCIQQNAGDSPYSSNGILVSHKPMIYECGASCMCSPNCHNRVSQKGLRIHFEVFKTRDRGWGLRSWDHIRAGSFICEYTGEVIEKKETEDEDDDGEFTFEGTRVFENSFEWNTANELLGEQKLFKPSEPFKPVPVIISAKKMGNISRFINHSCSPNVFWQPVLYDHADECFPHIMFFAIKHIPPMTELTYDYGITGTQLGKELLGDADGPTRKKKCLCGSSKCRGFFG